MILVDVDMPDNCETCPFALPSDVSDPFGYRVEKEEMYICAFTSEPVGYMFNRRYESYVGDIRADDCPLQEVKEETND